MEALSAEQTARIGLPIQPIIGVARPRETMFVGVKSSGHASMYHDKSCWFNTEDKGSHGPIGDSRSIS